MISLNKFIQLLTLPLTLWYINRLAYVIANTCETEHCYEIANRIKMSMNTEADPCTDFYEYSCGSWKIHNPLPEGELQWSTDEILMENTRKKIRSIVEKPDKPDDVDPVRKMKRFYRSCMDTETLEKKGIASLVNIIESTGGWPMVVPNSTKKPPTVPWQEVDMAYSNIDGRNMFFSILYTHDDVDLTKNVLLVDEEASYPLLKDNTEVEADAETIIKAFAEVIAKTVRAFMNYKGVTIEKDQFAQDVMDIILFEFSLRNVTNQDKKGEKNEIEKMTIASLQKWYDSLPHEHPTSNGLDYMWVDIHGDLQLDTKAWTFPMYKLRLVYGHFLEDNAYNRKRYSIRRLSFDWLKLLQYSFNMINATLSPDEPIFVASKESLKKLSALLDETPQRTIVNYIQWVFISRYIAFTTKELREAKYVMYSTVYNTTFQVPRWKECIKQIGMQDAISYVFVKKYFSKRGKLEAEDMVDRIKEQIAIGINQSLWTTSVMKNHMIEKLDAVKEQVGYPEWYSNTTYIETIYDELEITDDFFQNVLNYGKFIVIERAEQFLEPVDKESWLEYPTTVNAFYSERDNIIIIPAAELQEPFFTPGLPDAINYGSVGFIIGHELSHGFDHVGIKYDKHGNQVTKKVEKLLAIYKCKAQCFVDQFNRFAFNHTDEHGEPILLNGDLTENENIADSTGIKVAYLAYRQKADESQHIGERRSLPYLSNFSDDQLFFLSFSTSWCGIMHPIYEKLSINVDVHSPSNFRIIGSLKNMRSFASAFKCPLGSPMNPRQKCTIWT